MNRKFFSLTVQCKSIFNSFFACKNFNRSTATRSPASFLELIARPSPCHKIRFVACAPYLHTQHSRSRTTDFLKLRCRSFATDKVELSDVFLNFMTGERMTEAQYEKLEDNMVLRVLLDGSKEKKTLSEAVSEADDLDLDAVVVSSDADMMVVKLMDRSKARHARNMQMKASVKNSLKVVTKELRLGLRIGPHDLEVKLRQAREFFSKGHRVRLFMQLRGKDFYNSQPEALEKVDQIASSLSSIATCEGNATLLGRVVSVLMVPGVKKPTPANSKAAAAAIAHSAVSPSPKAPSASIAAGPPATPASAARPAAAPPPHQRKHQPHSKRTQNHSKPRSAENK